MRAVTQSIAHRTFSGDPPVEHHHLIFDVISNNPNLQPQALKLMLYIMFTSPVLYLHTTSLEVSTTYMYFINFK